MARFLNQLLKIFHVFQNKESLSSDVSDEEPIARFIFSSSHYAKGSERVKYGAYLPAKDGDSSVYRVSNLEWGAIWDIGKTYVEAEKRRIRACAEVKATKITCHSLTLLPETKSHYRHANIGSWPKDKDERKMLAIEIANNSKLQLPQI